MAQDNIALFLYGFDVTDFNKYINFKASLLGPELTGVLEVANYTASELMDAIKSAMEIADPMNTYTASINRTAAGNRENRITISTSGSYLDLLFGSGSNNSASLAPLIGFDSLDYTGSLTYTGSISAGTILIPDMPTWNYLGPENWAKNDGTKNVTANGIKETLVFAQMPFFQGEWRYITNHNGNTQETQWQTMMQYLTRQLKFEFTPDLNIPDTFYGATLESTPADGNGMAYKMEQMLDVKLYRFYKSGLLTFRVNIF